MIPRTMPTWQIKNWQDELQNLIVRPEELLELLELPAEWLPSAQAAGRLFPLRATRPFVARIRPGDPQDPLLLQILPLGVEHEAPPGYSTDPLEEAHFNPVPGVVHKYSNRVLLITATQCAINCRYCFRRHFPYADNQLGRPQWERALDYLRGQPQINEVILSGGDPLSISDRQLAWLAGQLAEIPHLTRLRVHTRYPVILPSRITEELLAALTGTRLRPVMVVHCNHAQELDDEVRQGLTRLKQAGITLLNQSVLLKDINDNSKTLATLSEALFKAGVLPYYLHLMDKVKGAAHFVVEDHQAQALYQELLTLLPGYLVPKLVRETPFAQSKTPVPPLL